MRAPAPTRAARSELDSERRALAALLAEPPADGDLAAERNARGAATRRLERELEETREIHELAQTMTTPAAQAA